MIEKIFSAETNQTKSLIEYINFRVQLPTPLKDVIQSVCKEEELGRGDLLIKQDSVAHRLFFIKKGSARTFYYHQGKDVTSWIYREGQIITSWSSFFTRTPSHESVELAEDSTVISISYDDLQNLYRSYPKMQEFGRIMVESQLVFLEYFYKGFFFISAKEKYDLLLSIFPDVTQRVNLGHIASFLGISQETLSRIRKKK